MSKCIIPEGNLYSGIWIPPSIQQQILVIVREYDFLKRNLPTFLFKLSEFVIILFKGISLQPFK